MTDYIELVRMFPIMRGADIPWAVIAPHDDQARRNHSQSLEKLASRGGLGTSEALDVLLGQPYGTTQTDVPEALAALVKERWYLPAIEALQAALTQRHTDDINDFAALCVDRDSYRDRCKGLEQERDEAQKWYEREAEAGSERERERDHWKARAELAEAEVGELRRLDSQSAVELMAVRRQLKAALDNQDGER